jgi:hypothetical protein
MYGRYGDREVVAREIGCQFRPGTDRIVSRLLVKAVCKAIWPESTDANVATVCGCSVRNAARILSGELALPAVLLAVINVELTKRP